MSLKTSDALTKWCPFARSVDLAAAKLRWEEDVDPSAWRPITANRNSEGQSLISCRCIGPACMAWTDTTPSDRDGPAPNYDATGFCKLMT